MFLASENIDFTGLSHVFLLGGGESQPRIFGSMFNSWGRGKKQIIASRVGDCSPARFLCTAEEDSISDTDF